MSSPDPLTQLRAAKPAASPELRERVRALAARTPALRAGKATADQAATLPPTAGRLQRYDAELRLRVDDLAALSGATQKAMRIARSLGGYVASAAYHAPPPPPPRAGPRRAPPRARGHARGARADPHGGHAGDGLGFAHHRADRPPAGA